MVLIPGRLESFPSANFPFSNGLDLGRTIIGRAGGFYEADPTAEFRAGMLVARNASGLIIPCAGVKPMGVAKWNKSLFLKAPVVGEAVVLPGVTAHNLKHANVENVRVTSLAGAPYADPGDYSANTTNGTITRNGAGTIADGETVLVTYTFELSQRDLDFQGRNFFNFVDDVSVNQNRITVINDWSLVFTTQYDTAITYTVNEALYAAGGVTAALAGLFTTDIAEGPYVGNVAQVPTATDPFLGVE